MALNIEDKQAIVAEITDVASHAVSSMVVNYRGLTVSDLTKLRADARKSGVYLKVAPNTLARRALDSTSFASLSEVLVGPSMLAFSSTELSAPARLFRDYAKEYECLEVKALSINGRLFQASELDYVAKLPTYDEAISTLMSVMEQPITNFVRTLAAPHTKLVRLFAAIRDQKQAA